MTERKRRRRYDREFKIESVRLVQQRGGSVSSVASDLGISPNVLQRWKRELSEDSGNAFPGNGRLKELDEAMRRLSRENKRLKEERDILKKALAIFSTHPE